MNTRNRQCVSCGRQIDWDSNLCPHCGHDYRIVSTLASSEMYEDQVSLGVRVLLYIVSLLIPIAGVVIGIVYYTKPDRESKHIGKMCLVLAVVSVLLTVTLAAVLYVMVLGFGSVHEATPASALTMTTVTGGRRFTFAAPTTPIQWGHITLVLSDGENAVMWSPLFSDMDGGGYTSIEVGYRDLYEVSVLCTVTDIVGNGFINNGDSFTLTVAAPDSFSATTTYTVTVLYEPTDGAVCSMSFTG
jgi:hypothetical protein